MRAKISRFFKFEERQTNFRKETIGGFVTFLAMSYILVVNPGIASGLFTGQLGEGIPYGGVFFATAAGAFLATALMAFLANLPIALAPGMGVNVFFIGTIVGIHGYTWQEALALSFIGGLIFLIISLTGLRKMLVDAIPNSLKAAIGAGIGFFIALVGLRLGGLFDIIPVIDGAGSYVGNNFSFTLGNFSDPFVLLSCFSIVLILVLHSMKNKVSNFSFIISILGTAVVGLILNGMGVSGMPSFGAFDYSALADIKEVAFSGFAKGMTTAFTSQGVLTALVLIYALLFVDIFDTTGTLVAVGRAANLEDSEGNIPNIDRALTVDAIGTLVSSTLGTPEITSFVESATGVEAGAKTGYSNLVVAVLFLLSIALFPVFELFTHSSVTVGALVLVGVLMSGQLKEIKWDDLTEAIPAFITIVFMVITGSIADGIAFGFISHVVVQLARGNARKVHPILYASVLLFILYLVFNALVIYQ